MEFKEKLQILRTQMRIPQEELAAKLNISRQSVTKWENGQSFPDIQNLIQLSDIFKVSIDRLVKDKLFTVDHYSSDSHVFSSHGYSLHIDNDLVADAFADLTQQEQSILILCIALDMKDGEIGNLMGMSRSSVQRRRTNALKKLRTNLMAFMPKGG